MAITSHQGVGERASSKHFTLLLPLGAHGDQVPLGTRVPSLGSTSPAHGFPLQVWSVAFVPLLIHIIFQLYFFYQSFDPIRQRQRQNTTLDHFNGSSGLWLVF